MWSLSGLSITEQKGNRKEDGDLKFKVTREAVKYAKSKL